MTDDATQSPPTAQPAPQSGADQKNPLDVLEELLNNAQARGGSAGGAGAVGGTTSGSAVPGQTGPGIAEVEAAAKAQEEAQKAEEERQRQELIQRQQQQDEQQLAEQRRLMEQIKNTPQYQARVVQDKEKAQQDQTQVANEDGYEIEQIEHTKI